MELERKRAARQAKTDANRAPQSEAEQNRIRTARQAEIDNERDERARQLKEELERMQTARKAELDDNQARQLEIEGKSTQAARQVETEEDQDTRLATNRLRVSNNRKTFLPLLVYLREKSLIHYKN